MKRILQPYFFLRASSCLVSVAPDVSRLCFTFFGIIFAGERLRLEEVMEETVPSTTAMSTGTGGVFPLL